MGLALAVDLGVRDIPAILVSENTETALNPKCNFSNARTMEHFRRLGIANEVRQSGLANTEVPRVVAYRNRFVEHELGRIDLSFMRDQNWPGAELPHHINQMFLEPLLRRNAEANPSVDVRFGRRATGLKVGDGGAEVTVEDVATGTESTIRARYVIGCDGARSMVRRAIGANFIGEDGSEVRSFVSGTMLSYFIKAPDLFKSAKAGGALMTWIVNHDARGFIYSQNGRDQFIVHYGVPPGIDWQSVSAKDVLGKMLGSDVEYEILSYGPWTGGLALVADNYGTGPAFVAGDAAHLFTPLGGFGMNTGIGDAMNIGWKLAAMYQGWGGEHLLQSYDPERRPIGIRNSSIGVHCAKRKNKWQIPADINENTENAQHARDTFGAFVVEDDRDEYVTMGLQLGERYVSDVIIPPTEAPPEDRWDVYVASDAAGARAPHFMLDDGRPLYDAFGLDFGLLAFDGEDTTPLEETAIKRNLPLKVIEVAKQDPQYTRRLVLIRPDGHIAWSGDACPSDALALIDKVRGADA